MRWLELTVEADLEAVEAVSEILGAWARRRGASDATLRDPADELAVREDPTAPYELTAHLPDDAAAPAAIEQTERALWHLQAFGLRPVGGLRVRPVEDRDWTEAWKAGYEPQRIGRLLIAPSWLEPSADADAVVLRLDPGMAFGTGLHPTTRACSARCCKRWSRCRGACWTSAAVPGILGIAALALGAERVDALDTDPEDRGGHGGQRPESTASPIACRSARQRWTACRSSPTRWCSPTWWPWS